MLPKREYLTARTLVMLRKRDQAARLFRPDARHRHKLLWEQRVPTSHASALNPPVCVRTHPIGFSTYVPFNGLPKSLASSPGRFVGSG